MTIEKAVKALAKKKGTLPTILIGKVKDFDETKWLATITFNAGFTDDDIRVRAVIDSNDSGILVKPKIGSMVLCAQIEGKLESMVVLTWSEIELFKVNAPKIELRNEDFGGLVKLEQLEKNLKALKDAYTKLKTATAAGLTAVGAGSAANGATGASTFNSQTASVVINFQDMENKNIKHG